MSRVFNTWLQELADGTGYTWDFLAECFNELAEESDEPFEDVLEFFATVTLERDW